MNKRISPTSTSAHLIAGIVGAIAMVIVWMRELDVLDGALTTMAGIAFVLSALILFLTRNADEYVAALWRSGTNAAFLGLLACYIFAPAAEGFFDGLTGNERGMDFPISLAPTVAFTFFFVAHFWARIRGTY